ncbi:hypothetical protein IZU99_09780 [Oscillospiraceae bacterium CM]|nr:hypothetical protein IZU99_09780 [Oscillospiraceae bacterium CM]
MKAMKKMLAGFFAAVLLVGAASITCLASGTLATISSSSVKISDKTMAFEAYTIGGNNYFKLRDIAMALSYTSARFSVDYDAGTNSIYLFTNKYYVPVGGELTSSGGAATVTAYPTTSNVYLNGQKISLTAYTIGGYNYFKLRDIGMTLNFGVTYDAKYNIINVDPNSSYYLAAFFEVLPNAGYDAVTGVINAHDTDTGTITINIMKETYYKITAEQLTTTHDLTVLKNVLGVLVASPDTIMTALKDNKDAGTKTMTLGDRQITYYYTSNTRYIEISW